VEIDIATPDGLGQARVATPMLLPHQVFAALHMDPINARQRLGIDPASFWEKLAGTQYLRNHPVVKDPVKWSRCLPLGFHGDSAKFTKQDSLMCLSWNGILAEGRDPLDNRHLIVALPTTWLLPGTLWQLTEVVAWSFAALLDGTWPLCDHRNQPWPADTAWAMQAGRPLADGLCACALDFRGDWQFQCQFWNFPTWNALEMCWLCHATKHGDTSWDFFGADAAWRSKPRTTQ
jgi:hypothetical protein